MTDSLTIALSKGRILDETLPLLAAAGIEPLDNPRISRKLIFATNQSHIRLGRSGCFRERCPDGA